MGAWARLVHAEKVKCDQRGLLIPRIPTLILLLALVFFQPAVAADVGELRYLGRQIVPAGTEAYGTTVGGLSGIYYDSATDSYWVISDDRSQHQPARFYNLSLDLSEFNKDPSPGMNGVTFHSVAFLRQPDDRPFPKKRSRPGSYRRSGIDPVPSGDGSIVLDQRRG